MFMNVSICTPLIIVLKFLNFPPLLKLEIQICNSTGVRDTSMGANRVHGNLVCFLHKCY